MDIELLYDLSYVLVVLGVILCSVASAKLKSTYKKFSKVANMRGITADECAATILRRAGIDDVSIEVVRGNLTDHYAPKQRVLRLSQTVYGSTSIAALGVAAHECGHAIQHHTGYFPIKLRSVVIPVANFGSVISMPVILVGILAGSFGLARVGVYLFLGVLLLEFITLNVEFDASRRALAILDEQGFLTDVELDGAKKVLKAAAMTYVMSLLTTLIQLFRLIVMAMMSKRDD